MKAIVSLLFISCCISSAWADEFKIEVSKDLIQTYSQPISGLEEPVLQKDHNQLPIEIKPVKANSDQQSSDSKSIQNLQNKPSPPTKTSESTVVLQRSKPKQSSINPLQMKSNDGLMPRNMLAADPDPDLGFYPNLSANQNQSYDEFLEEMHDELRLMVGEEVYSKMAWTYLDLKRLDNWIYETTSQFALFSQQALSGNQAVVGLSNQIKAELFFMGLMGSDASRLQSMQLGSQVNVLQTQYETEQAIKIAAADAEIEGKFFGVLKYLTILNFVYFILAVMAFVYIAKLFRFLVKQQ
jgi:hypothetical protein